MVEFVAELSINHLGMVNIAKKMIIAADKAGANYIKLKYKNVDKYYSSNQKKWRNLNFKDYRASLELSKDDFKNIAQFCHNHNIKWFCTVHDEEGLDFIKQFKPPFYKIASMDCANVQLLEGVKELCANEDKPMIISIGGKDNDFTDNLIKSIKQDKLKAFVLHTVSIYPTPTGKSNVGYIKYLIDKYEDDNIKIGYSGHEQGFSASLMAANIGAKMIERHFTLSRDLNIHHIKCALLPSEFSEMIKIINEMKYEISNFNFDGFYNEELSFLKNKEYQ